MSSKTKMHYVVWRTHAGFSPKGVKKRFKRLGYVCNGACYTTKSKMTRDISKVNCRNCISRLQKRGKIK